jgi:D-3-phosphoglycerate dehydrogenase|tara:strand:- start:222 stop:1190 length:969 start_codon:yes stop_codon:yes gene_type:complete
MNTLDKVAVTSRSFSANESLVKELKKRYSNIQLNTSGKTLKGEDLLEFLHGQNKVIVGLENFNKELIEQLPELHVISKFGVGLNNIDLRTMADKSIALGFQPGTNKQSVAELALMHMLIALRKLPNSKEEILNNIWSQNKGHELYGKSVGIIGFGNIGQRLAELLEPFHCNIFFYDNIDFSYENLKSIYPKKSDSFINNINQKPLNTLLESSDIISIHIPLVKETQNLIQDKEFGLMKEDIRIINTSRGGIVDEDALLKFLTDKTKAFAGFDVFETEPAFNHPLLKLNNFYATSHLGSMTIEGVISMGMAAINGLDENDIPL